MVENNDKLLHTQSGPTTDFAGPDFHSNTQT